MALTRKLKVTYRQDYHPSSFLITHTELTIELNPEKTRVQAILTIKRNPALSVHEKDLILLGEELQLMSVHLNGKKLHADGFTVSENELLIKHVPAEFTLTTECIINPKNNTELMGLYLSRDIFCTQCEAEGFRRITYYLDRPDILSIFTTKVLADSKRYPVLLSNGNCIEQGKLAKGRHFATWHDPFPKPCYLFAMVAGKLTCQTDHFQTQSKREVALRIYVDAQDIKKTNFAMQAIKQAMRWDEISFGREYDLDIFMIVAIHDFNMGAMENKGLNIFNAKYVLADLRTATDVDYENILSVIGHEYFHNWTGNRVTCRDWFQLSLKEGLTIFRDQTFSQDVLATPVCRIEDVKALRASQFPEDAGPLAHPVRPDSYIEINNFYTSTIYNKGAEVIRMMQQLLGREGFRHGMDLYFSRHDGQAVTIEDFVRSMEDANKADLTRFRRWYAQAGTPQLKARWQYQRNQHVLDLELSQECKPTPHQAKKLPFVIPVVVSLYSARGQVFVDKQVIVLNDKKHHFRFKNIPHKPIISLLQGFSAPVQLTANYSDAELSFLISLDKDPFNRYEAWCKFSLQVVTQLYDDIEKGQALHVPEQLMKIWSHLLQDEECEAGMLGLLLTLPEENYIVSEMKEADPIRIHLVHRYLKEQFTKRNQKILLKIYKKLNVKKAYEFNPIDAGKRRLKNFCLHHLLLIAHEHPEYVKLAATQFKRADNMTDKLAALGALKNTKYSAANLALKQFYNEYADNALVLDKWFTVQAVADHPATFTHVQNLIDHPDFQLSNPNRVRALLGAWSYNNPAHFHLLDGQGYHLLGIMVAMIDRQNGMLAARLAEPLTRFRQYAAPYSTLMREELTRLHKLPNISRDLFEIVSKSLG